MIDQDLAPTGRSGEGEYAGYASDEIDQVPGDNAVAALEAAEAETLALLDPLLIGGRCPPDRRASLQPA